MHDRHAVHLALISRLRAQAADIRRLAGGLDEAALATRTIPDKWSLKELVCHCRRMEDVFGDRFARILAEDTPAIAPYSPDDDETFAALCSESAASLLDGYLARREALCRRLEALSPADWHRKGRHPEFDHYDLHFGVEYMAHHEAHHIFQMFQRRAPLGRLPH